MSQRLLSCLYPQLYYNDNDNDNDGDEDEDFTKLSKLD